MVSHLAWLLMAFSYTCVGLGFMVLLVSLVYACDFCCLGGVFFPLNT